MACGLYDRMIDIYRGAVAPDGIELNFIDLDGSAGAREIFDRMAGKFEFDLAEFSGSEFIARRQAGDDSFVAIPVFPSRVFRHGMITVNKSRGIIEPKDLEGRRVGVPIYSMSAAIWICGQLQSDYQVDLSTITWVEGAVDAPGPHGSPNLLPLVKKVDIEENTTGKSLSSLLEDGGENGGIDALIGTVLPRSYFESPDIVRLFPNYREIERDYYRRTRIFPIMHLIAIRRDVYERHPFIASSLFDAFCESKDRARARMRDLGTLQYMLPWMTDDIDEIDDVFDGDAWPYGIEPNRPTLEAFVAYLVTQGIIKSPIAIEELFVPTHGRYSSETGKKNF
jgi:4,5-dihydroxyphthalate decarboxylase